MKLSTRPQATSTKTISFERRVLAHERRLQGMIGNERSIVDHLLHRLVVPTRKS